MRGIRRLLLVLPLVMLLCIGALAVWTAIPQRYQADVEYARLAITDNSPYWPFGRSTVIQQWTDVQHRRERLQIGGLATPIYVVRRDGCTYASNVSGMLFTGSGTEQWIEWLLQQSCAPVGHRRPGAAMDTTMQLAIGSGYVAAVRCKEERLARGTLAADISDPPHSVRSLWDRLTAWFRAQSRMAL